MQNRTNLSRKFTDWCKQELFTADLIQAADLMQEALDTHLLEIYSRLNLDKQLNVSSSPRQVAAALGYIESAHLTIEAMLERLASRYAFVEQTKEDGEPHFQHVGKLAEPVRQLDEIEKDLANLGADFAAPLEFLGFGSEYFEYALKDDPDFLDKILSGRDSENQELWFRATNVDPLQNVHGIMGAVAIDMLFDSGDILEIGGGTGNGIRNFFEHLARKDELGRVHRYVFTDISPKFVLSTRHEIVADYPDVECEWRFVDLNAPLEEQKIEPGKLSLIYAVNAAHVAKDIVAFLKSCKEALIPGGRVLFAERIRLSPRDMAPRELALNLSVYHRTAAIRNDDYRPMHCYLSPENWLRVLDLAGFSQGEIWPDLQSLEDSFPNQYAAIVTGVA